MITYLLPFIFLWYFMCHVTDQTINVLLIRSFGEKFKYNRNSEAAAQNWKKTIWRIACWKVTCHFCIMRSKWDKFESFKVNKKRIKWNNYNILWDDKAAMKYDLISFHASIIVEIEIFLYANRSIQIDKITRLWYDIVIVFRNISGMHSQLRYKKYDLNAKS